MILKKCTKFKFIYSYIQNKRISQLNEHFIQNLAYLSKYQQVQVAHKPKLIHFQANNYNNIAIENNEEFRNKFKNHIDMINQYIQVKPIKKQDVKKQLVIGSNHILKVYDLFCVAYMMKENTNNANLQIKSFYENEFKENEKYQYIVKELMKLSKYDLVDFIVKTSTIIYKEQIFKLNPNQKLYLACNFLQVGLHEYLHIYIRQLILSINNEEFQSIKYWRIVNIVKEIPKLNNLQSYRDLDYINEQICNMLITHIKELTPTSILSMSQQIATLCSINSKSCFPFKQFIHQLQLHVNDLIQQSKEGKLPLKADETLIKQPVFVLGLINVIFNDIIKKLQFFNFENEYFFLNVKQMVKFNQDVDEQFIKNVEEILFQYKPQKSPFKANLLYFNTLSVLNAGESILELIATQIQDKQSSYYKQALNYDCKYILKLIYNEQLLYLQKSTQNIWKNKFIYQDDIKDITLFKETQLFKCLDEIVSQKITNLQTVDELDNQTQLIFRRIYGMQYKQNNFLHELALQHAKQNSNIFNKENKTKLNEFNSDIINYLKEKQLDFEVEKSIGFRECDIYIPSLNLVIELDGKYHNLDSKSAKDKFRDIVYLKLDYKLLVISILKWENIRIEGTIQEVLDEQFNLFTSNPNLVMTMI